MAKCSDKEWILKPAEENSCIQGNPHKDISGFFNRNFVWGKKVVWDIQSAERKKSAAKNTLSSKAAIQNRRDKQLPNKVKLKEFITSKPALQGMLEGNLWVERKGHNQG